MLKLMVPAVLPPSLQYSVPLPVDLGTQAARRIELSLGVSRRQSAWVVAESGSGGILPPDGRRQEMLAGVITLAELNALPARTQTDAVPTVVQHAGADQYTPVRAALSSSSQHE